MKSQFDKPPYQGRAPRGHPGRWGEKSASSVCVLFAL